MRIVTEQTNTLSGEDVQVFQLVLSDACINSVL